MIQALEPRHYSAVVGGITVPNVADRAPGDHDVTMSDVGTALSVISMFAGLTPAGMVGRTVIFAAGAVGMAMTMTQQGS